MRHQTVSVTEFKAKCLAMLDDLYEHGGTITITKRGRHLATVTRPRNRAWKSPIDSLAGKVKLPRGWDKFDTAELWDGVRDPDGVMI